jgi:site-specific recombinase XerD
MSGLPGHTWSGASFLKPLEAHLMSTYYQLPWEHLPAELEAEIRPSLEIVNVIDFAPRGATPRELRLTNGELIAAFAASWVKDDESIRDYQRDLIEYCCWYQGPILETSTPDLMRYYAYLQKERPRRVVALVDDDGNPALSKFGKPKEFVFRSGPIGPSSIKGQRAAKRKFFMWSSQQPYSQHHPTLGTELPKVVIKPGLVHTEEDMRSLLTAEGTPRCHTQAYTLHFLPIRVSTMQNIQWSDIDFERLVVTLTEVKHGQAGELPVHAKLARRWLRWREEQREQALELAAKGNPRMLHALCDRERERLFLTRNGRPVATSTFAKQLKWRARRAGVRVHAPYARVGRENTSAVHPHAARRGWASAARRRGRGAEHIKDVLLHKDISTTIRHYSFGDAAELRETVDGFDL